MSSLSLWLTICAMGLVTFLTRLSFILAWGKFKIPSVVRRALRYVPPAVLSAIILPELLRPNDVLIFFSFSNSRLVAGLIASLVAWRTRNALLTITVGLIIFWVLQAFVPNP